jgi:uncharacterized membrane protein
LNKQRTLVTVVIICFYLYLCNISSNSLTASENNRAPVLTAEYPLIFTHYEIHIRIENPELILINEYIDLKNLLETNLTELDLQLQPSYKDLFVKDDIGNQLNFTKENEFGLIRIAFHHAIGMNESYHLSLEYVYDYTLTLIEDELEYYLFAFNIHVDYFIEELLVKIRLPSYCFLAEPDSGPPPFIPDNATVTAIVNNVYLTWNFEDLEPVQNKYFQVLFTTPPPEPIPIWAIIIILLAGLTAGGIGVFLFMRRRELVAKKEVGRIFLTEDQKLILGLLVQNEGRISQKELLQLTDFSKAKVSRNLTALEQQGLLTKEKWGREYRVFVTKEGRRVIE